LSDPAPDDPLDPKRWRANPDGPITGDELAYLKDLIAHRMGVGNSDSPWFGTTPEPPPPPPRLPWWRRCSRPMIACIPTHSRPK
jgi:hypothetical protein